MALPEFWPVRTSTTRLGQMSGQTRLRACLGKGIMKYDDIVYGAASSPDEGLYTDSCCRS